jgi:hypothetical protein
MASSEEEYRDHFENVTGSDQYFDQFYEMWQETGVPVDMYGPDQEMQLFDEFVVAWYPDPEVSQEQWQAWREEWYDETGTGPEDIDWALWREVMDAETPVK